VCKWNEPLLVTEKTCPPLEKVKGKLSEAAKRVAPGAQGKIPDVPPLTIQMRAKTAAAVKATPPPKGRLPAKLVGDGAGVQKATAPLVFKPNSTAVLVPGQWIEKDAAREEPCLDVV
jgi:hypothetical protein